MKKKIIWTAMAFLFMLIITENAFSNDYKVFNAHYISNDVLSANAKSLDVQPGDTVYLQAGKREFLRLEGFHGDSESQIIFKNHGGQVLVDTEHHHYGILITNCSFFRFTGTGSDAFKYGIKILKTPAKANGLSIDGRSTDYEIDHIESSNTGFAGIFAFTQPNIEGTNNRDNFIQKNTSIHDNYIHHTYGEGMYIGHSFYGGYKKTIDAETVVLYPHEIHGLRVYNNIVDSCGWDGIQVSSASEDCEIYSNKVSYYGLSDIGAQKNGILIGGGTTGKCYNNSIVNGKGTGLMIFGTGNNLIYNNIIVNAGYDKECSESGKTIYGIFCDDRFTIPNASFNIVNNTIISSSGDGIRFYSKESKNNKIYNNLILNVGSFGRYHCNTTAYINLRKGVDVELKSNFYSQKLSSDINAEHVNEIFELGKNLDIVDKGVDVTALGIDIDFKGTERWKHKTCDIGAFEYNHLPTVKQEISQFKIYPNPSYGDFLISNEKEETIQKIVVVDSLGFIVFESNLASALATERINLKNLLTRGLYFVDILSNGKRFSQKLIIN